MPDPLPPWLQPLWQSLNRRIARLPHALLFHGARGTGKAQLVRQLAQRLLCDQPGQGACGRCNQCQLVLAGTHPDLMIIGNDERIGIDTIRLASQQMFATAQQAQAKVLIVEQVERMTDAAANAFLKTLEEPPGQSYLLLTSHVLDRVLPTIRSRCQLTPVRLPAPKTTLQWLTDTGVPGADAKLAMLFAGNAPLAAQDLVTGDQLAACRELTRKLRLLGDAPEQLYPVAQWLAEQGDAGVQWIKCYLYHGLKLSAAGKLSASASMPNLPVAGWLQLVDQCHQLERQRIQSAGLSLSQQLLPLLSAWVELRRG